MAGSIIYGLNAVVEAVQAGHPVNCVYVAKESRAKGYKRLLDAARERSVRVDFVPQAKLNTLTGTREHQGIAAAVSPADYTPLETCLAACEKHATLVLLDQIQHPKNLGMIIRTAAGAGAAGVLITARGGALLDEAVVRASAGTVFRVPVVKVDRPGQVLAQLKEAGFWAYGLDASADTDLLGIDWPERVVVVVGNESKGLRPAVRKACDETVRIPLHNGVESLNAAMAAGIALYQIRARRLR